MKKQILSLALWAVLLFPLSSFADAPNIAEILKNYYDNKPKVMVVDQEALAQAQANLHPDVDITEGGQLYLCFEDNANKLQKKTLVANGLDVSFEPFPLQAFEADNGNKNIALHPVGPIKGKITNTSEGISFNSVKIRAMDTDLRGRSVKMIFAVDSEKTPYMDYVPAGRDREPCDPNRIKYENLFLAKDADWTVVQLSTTEEAVPAPEPDAPPADDSNNALQDNVAPQSGGCSITTALSGFNYGFSMLFALILGAHALLRFRKK